MRSVIQRDETYCYICYAKGVIRWAPHPKEDHTIVMLLRIRGKEKPMRYTEAFRGRPAELKPLAALLFR